MTIDLTERIQARDGAAVVLYTKPQCSQCTLTKNRLDAAGIPYTSVDITEDEAALAYIKETLGYLSAPVVVVSAPSGDSHWYGFRPDLIATITEKRSA